MKFANSFFQSLDDWVDHWDVDEDKSLDCPNSECTGDCRDSCIAYQGPDLLEGPYVNSESYIWRLELKRAGAQWRH